MQIRLCLLRLLGRQLPLPLGERVHRSRVHHPRADNLDDIGTNDNDGDADHHDSCADDHGGTDYHVYNDHDRRADNDNDSGCDHHDNHRISHDDDQDHYCGAYDYHHDHNYNSADDDDNHHHDHSTAYHNPGADDDFGTVSWKVPGLHRERAVL